MQVETIRGQGPYHVILRFNIIAAGEIGESQFAPYSGRSRIELCRLLQQCALPLVSGGVAARLQTIFRCQPGL